MEEPYHSFLVVYVESHGQKWAGATFPTFDEAKRYAVQQLSTKPIEIHGVPIRGGDNVHLHTYRPLLPE